MYELAQNIHGVRVEPHAQTREYAVYRYSRPGGPGAPAKVAGPNRMHLHVAPTTSNEDFQRLVNHVAGRYKLVQVDEYRRPIAGAEAFYVDIMESEPARDAGDDHGDVIRELARANSHMVEVIAERFAGMMDSAARLIGAADGAGLPAREPAPVTAAPVTAPAAPAPEDEPAPPNPLHAMIASTLGQAGPLIQHLVLTKVLGLPPEVALKMMSGQLAAPMAEAGASAPTTPPTQTPSGATSAAPSATPSSAATVNPNNPAAYLVHLATIESLLSKREAVIARELIAAMTPAQVDAWRAKVCAMSAADAAAAIRAEIAEVAPRKAKAGGAS